MATVLGSVPSTHHHHHHGGFGHHHHGGFGHHGGHHFIPSTGTPADLIFVLAFAVVAIGVYAIGAAIDAYASAPTVQQLNDQQAELARQAAQAGMISITIIRVKLCQIV